MMPRGRPGRARCVEGQTARPRTSAPVAAAPSQERAHIALARNAHAQRAVDEGLGLNSAARSDAGDLGQRQLTRQNHACKTQRGQTARTVQALHAHLRGAVQRQARRHSAHKRGHGQILRDDGVSPGSRNTGHRLGKSCQLTGIQRGVQRYIHAHVPGMTKSHRLPQAFGGKIARRAAGIEFEARGTRRPLPQKTAAQSMSALPGVSISGLVELLWLGITSSLSNSRSRGAGAPPRGGPPRQPAWPWRRPPGNP